MSTYYSRYSPRPPIAALAYPRHCPCPPASDLLLTVYPALFSRCELYTVTEKVNTRCEPPKYITFPLLSPVGSYTLQVLAGRIKRYQPNAKISMINIFTYMSSFTDCQTQTQALIREVRLRSKETPYGITLICYSQGKQNRTNERSLSRFSVYYSDSMSPINIINYLFKVAFFAALCSKKWMIIVCIHLSPWLDLWQGNLEVCSFFLWIEISLLKVEFSPRTIIKKLAEKAEKGHIVLGLGDGYRWTSPLPLAFHN